MLTRRISNRTHTALHVIYHTFCHMYIANKKIEIHLISFSYITSSSSKMSTLTRQSSSKYCKTIVGAVSGRKYKVGTLHLFKTKVAYKYFINTLSEDGIAEQRKTERVLLAMLCFETMILNQKLWRGIVSESYWTNLIAKLSETHDDVIQSVDPRLGKAYSFVLKRTCTLLKYNYNNMVKTRKMYVKK